MSGYDATEQIPALQSMFRANPGQEQLKNMLASGLYNAYKSYRHWKDPTDENAMYTKDFNPFQSVLANVQGSIGLPTDDLALYNQIISGQTSAPATQSTSSAPSGNPIPEYYRNNPGAYDYDRWQQAYANALDARYGTGQGGGTTTIGPGGQIQTSFGSWDPSRTYGAYQSNTQTSSDRPFFESYSDPTQRAQFENIMTSQYGAPGYMKPYYSKGGLAHVLGV